MKGAEKVGLILLGVWLIVTGLVAFGLNIPTLLGSAYNYVMGAIAVVSGLLIIIGKR